MSYQFVEQLHKKAVPVGQLCGRVYGSRRLGAVLRAQGLRIGRHRVRRLMRENRLRALWRRKFVHTIDSGHGPCGSTPS